MGWVRVVDHGAIASSSTDGAPYVACLHHHCVSLDSLVPNPRIHKIRLPSSGGFAFCARKYTRTQPLVQDPTCRRQHPPQRPLHRSSSTRYSSTSLCVGCHLVDGTSHLERNLYCRTIRKSNHFTAVADSHVLSPRRSSLSPPSIHHRGDGVVYLYHHLATSSRHIYGNLILSHLCFLGLCFRRGPHHRRSRKSHLKYPQ